MALHYERYAVALAFHAENPGTLSPSEARLAQYDAALFGTYDAVLRSTMAEYEIPVTPEATSLLVALAVVSSGTAATRVDDACAYYRAVRPIAPPAVAFFPSVAAAPVGATRSKGTAARKPAAKTGRKKAASARKTTRSTTAKGAKSARGARSAATSKSARRPTRRTRRDDER